MTLIILCHPTTLLLGRCSYPGIILFSPSLSDSRSTAQPRLHSVGLCVGGGQVILRFRDSGLSLARRIRQSTGSFRSELSVTIAQENEARFKLKCLFVSREDWECWLRNLIWELDMSSSLHRNRSRLCRAIVVSLLDNALL